VLTNADVDHVTGLLTLREVQPLAVYSTRRVAGVVRSNVVFNVLNPSVVDWRDLALEQRIELRDREGRASGIVVTPFAVPGKVALWLEDPSLANFGSIGEDTIGLKVECGGKRFFYTPGCASLPAELARRLAGADLVFFDGTTFTDTEMIDLGLGVKTAQRMGHMSQSGPEGSMEAFAELGVKRKIYVHINNSNPVWRLDAPERAAVAAAGWEIGYDGMEITL
jgi:pyrroloquinoline quinone biosynthesis protein B